MTYTQALDYIHSVCWKGSRPGLSRITELCCRLGNPQDNLKFIHVAGTNGKGSTCAMLDSILRAEGLRVGLFTSPFILTFNERMRVNGQNIPDDVLAEVTEMVKPHADQMADAPTEFELITAIAFVYFLKEKCDVVILEAGMGGRLDSTNIIKSKNTLLSIITGIAMDHTAFLGDTPEKIAYEKAGIIKAGVPVLFGGHHAPIGGDGGGVDCQAVANVIQAVATEKNAPYAETDFSRLKNVQCDLSGCVFDFGDMDQLYIPLLGVYQPYNAATVLTAVEMLTYRGMPTGVESIRKGLSNVTWQGRFEILCKEPLVISDGGHNPEGVDAAVAGVKQYLGGEKVYLLTGVMADKDFTPMVRRMAEVAERVFAVRPNNDRAMAAIDYAHIFEDMGIPAKGYDSIAEAVFDAMDACLEEHKTLLCLGSLYMYGEVREAVLSKGEGELKVEN